MTTRQKLELELSELRQSINDLLAVESDKLSDEQRADLEAKTGRIQHAEVEFRAAIVSEETIVQTVTGEEAVDSEKREVLQLRSKSSITSYVKAAVEMRSVGGPEAEFNAALKIGGDQFPLALLAPENVKPRTRTFQPISKPG